MEQHGRSTQQTKTKEEVMTTLTVDTQAKQNPGVRELSLREVEQVGGGVFNNWFTGAGSIFSTESIAAASRFAGGLGLLYGSYNVGNEIGSWVYDRYETQINDFVWNTIN
jgi:hypothetical protein